MSKRSQSISFPSIATQNLNLAPISLRAASSVSGLTPSFRVVSGPAQMVSSNQLVLTALGAVRVQAYQAGDDVTLAGASVQTFQVADFEKPKVKVKNSYRSKGDRFRLQGKVSDNHVAQKI